VSNIRDQNSAAPCVPLSDLTFYAGDPSISHADVTASPAVDSSENLVVQTAKRVLLLEDDSSFREIITDLLIESGYEVKAVQSGVEGIQEVLAGDFAVILCDMMMPGLPGDLFFHAVDRARPQLCQRFVFMTGRRGDAVSNDFISAVLAPALLKPFGLQELLQAIQEVEQRRVVQGKPTSHAIATRSTPKRPVLASPAPIITKSADVVGRVSVARPPDSIRSPAARLSDAITESDQRSPFWINLSKTLVVVSVTALLWGWHLAAEGRTAKALMEAQDLEKGWSMAAEKLEEAKQDAARGEESADRAAKVTTEFQRIRWATALEKIVDFCTTTQIQLQEFWVRQDLDGSNAPNRWSLHIAAQYAGSGLDADSFRLKLKKELELVAGKDLEVVLTDLVLLPATAPETEGPNIRFAIDATNVATGHGRSSPNLGKLK
jgi:CheY-like chemotaxis protein